MRDQRPWPFFWDIWALSRTELVEWKAEASEERGLGKHRGGESELEKENEDVGERERERERG